MSENGRRMPSTASSTGSVSPRRSRRTRSSTTDMSEGRESSSRRSLLPDNTDIDLPRRRSWWKRVDENSINYKEVFGNEAADGQPFDIENIVQENAGPSNMEKKKLEDILNNMSDSSTNETLGSIQIPQRKLFTERQTQQLTELENINKNPTQTPTADMDQPSDISGESLGSVQLDPKEFFTQKKTKQPDDFLKIMKKRESLRKNITENEKTVHVSKKHLFSKDKTKENRNAAYHISINATTISTKSVKVDNTIAIDAGALKKNLFKNKQHKKPGAYPISIMSETDDDTVEVQNRLTAFNKIPQIMTRSRRASATSRSSKRSHSPASFCSETMEVEDWKLLPSSTMIGENILTSTPAKKLCREKINTEDVIIQNSEDNHHHEVINDIEQNVQNFQEKKATNNDDAVELKHVSNSESMHESKVEEENKSKLEQREECNVEQGDKSKVKEKSKTELENKSKPYNDDEIIENNLNEKNECVNEIYNHNIDTQSNESDVEEDKSVLGTDNESGYELEKSDIQNDVENHSQENLDNLNAITQGNENKTNKKIHESPNSHKLLENYDIGNEYSTEDRSHRKNTAESDNEGAREGESAGKENDHNSLDKRSETEVEQKQSQEVQNEIHEQQNKTQEENDSQEDGSQAENNDSQEEIDESQEEDQNESEEEKNETQVQNDSQEEQYASQEGNNDSQEEINESQEEDNRTEDQNQSEEEKNETQEQNDSQEEQYASQEGNNDSQEELNESQEEVNESQEEDNRTEEQNKSEEEENMSQEEENVSGLNNEEADDSEQEEFIEDMDVSENNEEMHSPLEDELQNEDDDVNQEQNNSDDDDDDFQVLSFKNRRNDTTRSNKSKSIGVTQISEDGIIVSKNDSSQMFTKNINSTNIDPGRMSTAEHSNRYSADFSKNLSGGARSSTESSGWNSHTTAYIQRAEQTMNARKSLRALVLSKSANARPSTKQIEDSVDEVEHDFSRPATPTQVQHDSTVNESTANKSLNMTQTKITKHLSNIAQENLQHRQKIQEKVKRSLKRPVTDPNCERTYFQWSKQPQENAETRMSKNTKRNKDVNTLVTAAGVQAHKAPKLFKPPKATWITEHLYKFLHSKLLPKHNKDSRYQCEKFVCILYEMNKHCLKRTTDTRPLERTLKEKMASMGLVYTHFEFYKFLQKYMPKEFCIKMVPDLFNGLPVPPDVFGPIITPVHREACSSRSRP